MIPNFFLPKLMNKSTVCGTEWGWADYAASFVGAELAQPARYSFSYRVSDRATGQEFGQREQRSGDNTGGEYRVRLPDGRRQVLVIFSYCFNWAQPKLVWLFFSSATTLHVIMSNQTKFTAKDN